MKSNIKHKFGRMLLVTFLVLLGSSSCKKEQFLLPDRMAMDERLWENEGATQLYINGIYNVVIPEFPYTTAAFNIMYLSDENIFSVTDGTLKKAFNISAELRTEDYKFIGSKYQGSNKGDNKYFDIGRINLALERIPGSSLPDDSKRRFLGQLYMLRAISYFDLVRIYGGVPLVMEYQDPENLTLSGRRKAADCLEAIVTDLDSAASKLNGVIWNDDVEYGKLTKLAAVSYKARVLLYAAGELFNPQKDASKWVRALKASQEAYDLCLSSGKDLMSDYATIFQVEGKANPEAIMIRGYSKDLEKRFQDVERKSRPGGLLTGGSPNDCYVPTSRLLDAYTMKDGTPIAQSSSYDPVLYWKNRDPRFYATIAYNGSDWKLSGITGRKQWNYNSEIEGSSKPFYCKRFTDPNLAAASAGISNDRGGNGFDWIELRMAEVILNYAECLNETSDLTGSKAMVRKIRVRAGIQQGTNDYGMGSVTTKEQMQDLIMNERMVEFAFEGKRGFDLRRTRKMHLLTGFLVAPTETTKSIKKNNVTYNLKLQLEEINPENNKRRRDTLNTNSKSTYEYFFTRNPNGLGNSNNAIVFPEKNYFIGLPNTFLNSSPMLEQTIGWGGTFDPL